MNDSQQKYQLILEINKLKLVLRNTKTNSDRNESTGEHSWSVSMIAIILMEELKKEFEDIDELKLIKLCLIHDIVEIYAGDVMAFDIEARKNKENDEINALKKIMSICPSFGNELHDLWFEFEKRETIEAKIAKAADAICPMFLRLQSKQSYIPFNISISDLEKTKSPAFKFSKIFSTMYQQLKFDLLKQKLIFEN